MLNEAPRAGFPVIPSVCGGRYLSEANPTALAGQKVYSEDDVLHIRTLPSFDGLGQADVELLVSYLTVPYAYAPKPMPF